MKSNSEKWLYLYFPELYLQYHFRENKHTPIAVYELSTHVTVKYCNSAASKSGISPGMSLSTAFCLCPKLETHKWSEILAEKSIRSMADLSSPFSSWIGLDNYEALFLEIGSMKLLFESSEKLFIALMARYTQSGITCKISVGNNPSQAQIINRAMLKNDKLTENSEQNIDKFIRNIDIEYMDCDGRMIERLRRSGILRIGDLFSIPDSDLAYRTDHDLYLKIQRLKGKTDWKPEAICPSPVFFWKKDLEQSFDSLVPLRFLLLDGLAKMCLFMQKNNVITSQVILTLFDESKPIQIVELSLAKPDMHLESWTFLLHTTLERLSLSGMTSGFHFKASNFFRLNIENFDLFNDSSSSSRSRAYLLNRLASRLGTDCVHFISDGEDPRPEKRTCYSHYHAEEKNISKNIGKTTKNRITKRKNTYKKNINSEHEKKEKIENSEKWKISPHKDSCVTDPETDRSRKLSEKYNKNITAGHIPLNPIWITQSPVRIRPELFTLRKGPIRICTGWWDSYEMDRDYYIATRSDNTVHWIFLDDKNNWYLHGTFS